MTSFFFFPPTSRDIRRESAHLVFVSTTAMAWIIGYRVANRPHLSRSTNDHGLRLSPQNCQHYFKNNVTVHKTVHSEQRSETGNCSAVSTNGLSSRQSPL
ncbi:unnamed protein product [Nezara viridula]|uniref:Uncharacterized protein n=1 Tax=Nezara viridula TaxID=85310 RepID=A0A9P0HMK3_NEZVI|nr:unnamed protein product [Nezara viridula]